MDLNNKRIMVVGGAGLIGSHVVDELLNTGVKEILVYDNMFRGNSHNLEEAIKDADTITVSAIRKLKKFDFLFGIIILFHC